MQASRGPPRRELRDSRRAAANALDQPPGLVALAALLPMPLDLAAKVLGDLVDRVQHLRRCLPGPQGGPLEVQRGLRNLAGGDRGVSLLGQLDLEHGELRNLPADSREALL